MLPKTNKIITIQFLRYAVVGFGSNMILYLGYLLATYHGMGHKTAMTLLYMLGVAQTFLFNKRWSFRHQGPITPALRRYIISYGIGYTINIFALWLLVDILRFSHQWVQGIMVFMVAAAVFLIQKYWVFAPNQNEVQMAR